MEPPDAAPATSVLATVTRADYARLVASRRRSAVLPVLFCSVLAAAILAAEYRLVLVALVVMLPALVPVLDAISIARMSKAVGSAEVRCDGEWLTLNPTNRVRVDALALVRVQPDLVVLVERVSPGKHRGHLLAVESDAQGPLLATLMSLGRTVKAEKSTIAQLNAFSRKVVGRYAAQMAAVLLLAGIGFAIQGFVNGPRPGWEAIACFGGAGGLVTLAVGSRLQSR